MAANEPLGPPYDELADFRPSGRLRLPSLGAPSSVTGVRALWTTKRRYLALHAPLVRELCADPVAGVPVDASWVLGILWDELARRDLFEGATDWLAGQIGRDPSVGPFQITGGTALDVVRFAAWGEPFRNHRTRELRELLLDFSFGARVAAGRLAQILAHWRDAGHDPFAPEGLGKHRLRPVELCGTLYCVGLGKPKPHPRSSLRGTQIAIFARQIARVIDDAPTLLQWARDGR